MRPVLVLAFFAIAMHLSLSAEAQCRNGVCSPPAIQYQMPSTAHATTGILVDRSVLAVPIYIQGEPVRNVGRAAVCVAARTTGRVLRGTARAVAFPFRWLRGCQGCR